MTRRNKEKPFFPHANEEPHRKLMDWLKKASVQEVFDLSIKAGIYNKDGTLTKHYRNFCDFCNCADCVGGALNLTHARTSDDRWICDVCYTYDLCTSGPNRNPGGPCEDRNCSHRPRLVSQWEVYKP